MNFLAFHAHIQPLSSAELDRLEEELQFELRGLQGQESLAGLSKRRTRVRHLESRLEQIAGERLVRSYGPRRWAQVVALHQAGRLIPGDSLRKRRQYELSGPLKSALLAAAATTTENKPA